MSLIKKIKNYATIRNNYNQTLILLIPPEQIQADENSDDRKQAELHLKSELELQGVKVEDKGVGESDAEVDEVIGEQGFYDVVAAGHEYSD
jgi:alpha/beta superfamily hydrolase